jgi:hypothetical protein
MSMALIQIVIADRDVEILRGFPLVPVPQGGVGNAWIFPASHGIREPAVPEVVERQFGIETHAIGRHLQGP